MKPEKAREYILSKINNPHLFKKYIQSELAGDFAGDLVDGFFKEVFCRDEALTILALKLNMSGEQLEELVNLCRLPLSERFKKMGIKKIIKDKP